MKVTWYVILAVVLELGCMAISSGPSASGATAVALCRARTAGNVWIGAKMISYLCDPLFCIAWNVLILSGISMAWDLLQLCGFAVLFDRDEEDHE